MNIEFDIASLLAGISLVTLTGWLGAFFALRKDEKSVHTEQVTKERAKWRSEMRMLTQEMVALVANDNIAPDAAKIASLRAKLATSLNPKSKVDQKVLDVFDKLEHKSDTKEFSTHMALLLKHDWERVKWECMPIYLKAWCLVKNMVFKIFGKGNAKELEWKSKGYRLPLGSESAGEG
ncbi:hypothetical protein O2V57_004483 [Vibrio parahaemolyticus]|nr:hypothetical protein [Vibrio parahaemolyticus]EGQ8699951.1 hypothetical protein [Vibrio parahaemolyticus]EGQ8751258.1 hypothetical protein [Vibrio parahaemolyticus]EGQ8759332.1 hypothetical protein [Vibrio parahaemolyticus]EGQ8773812.1 hypothetical protein [Vibrio parahaemolyticus]